MLENVPLFFPFAKQSQKAFVTLSWRNTTLGQSAAPASCRLLSMKKGTKRKTENGSEIFLANKFLLFLSTRN